MELTKKGALPVRKFRLRPPRIIGALLAGFFLFGALGGCGGKEETAEDKVVEELGLDEERGIREAPAGLDRGYARGHGLGGGAGLGGGEGTGGLGAGAGTGSHLVADIMAGSGDLDAIAERIAGRGGAEDTFAKRTIIKTGTLLIHVDDVDEGLARVQEVVAAQGGELVKVERRKYEDDDSCVIALRVPAGRFEAAISSAQKIGKVVELVVEAEDVTEEYVDLQMRLDNQVKARDRFIEILKTRTGKLEDVVAVQREINDTTEEIERLAGKILYLQNRAALSTIYITLQKPETLAKVEKEPEATLLDEVLAALREALGALFGIVLFIVQLGIVVVPLAAAALLVLFGARRLYLWARRTGLAARLRGPADFKKEE
jgi:hypothetical protein